MAALIGTQVEPVNTGKYGDKEARSCFGLAGLNYGGGGIPVHAAYCETAFNINLAIDANLHVWAALSGGYIRQVDILNNVYTCHIGCSPNSFTPTKDSVGTRLKSWTTDTTGSSPEGTVRVPWRQDFPAVAVPTDDSQLKGLGYVDLGHISRFHWVEGTQDGYLYVGGTTTYEVTDPIYPQAYRITLPGFKRFYDYYPCAVREGASWKSCNRQGGNVQIRKTGKWAACKNFFGDPNPADTVFIRKGWSFAKSALTGEGGGGA